jgi:peptidoglycan/LPS O-acetylase OafA/YrhL
MTETTTAGTHPGPQWVANAASGRARRPGLDLMRATAVLCVMFAHYLHNFSYWLSVQPNDAAYYPGELGVALFFGLSGYLIGGILLDIREHGGGPELLQRFLVRRWMRTLPAYWVWLCVLLISIPPAGDKLFYVLRFGTMTQDLWGPMPPGYWFAISWSLPIEEWFYIAFGMAAVLTIMRRGKHLSIWVPVTIFLLVPPMLRLADPSYHIFQTGHTNIVPLRLDEIAYGVAIVVLHRQGHPCLNRTGELMTAGLCILLANWLLKWWDPQWEGSRLGASIEPVVSMLGCVLCLPAAASLVSLPRWLAWAARTISRQSYALYLVHLTILVDLVQPYWWVHRDMTLPAMAVALVLPFVIAELLSRYVELPFMNLRPPQFLSQAG